MKLKELSGILYSNRDGIQSAIVYEQSTNTDLIDGCSIDYAVEEYAEREVKHIQAYKDKLVITV